MMFRTISPGQYVTAESVGNWGGREQRVADQFNRILDILVLVHPTADDSLFQSLIEYAWDYVRSDPQLIEWESVELATKAGEILGDFYAERIPKQPDTDAASSPLHRDQERG